MKYSRAAVGQAVEHLRSTDRVMRRLIDEAGPCTLRPQRDRFAMLVNSIISQQISTGAARSIRQRLVELTQPQGVTPAGLLRFSPEQLRTAGVSPQKASYVLDLAEKVHSGEVDLARIGRCADEQVISQLILVKGIGRWTAQMFLIFSLGRLDVLPHDDLGVRTGIRDRYELGDLPDKATCERIAVPWRPYATIASWYCWRSLDLKRTAGKG
ncbi:MAG: DNA-3-methyladenine glycosylase 2 family protein [Planctomycetales bacterium]|nr:DNA-3-methyladenine glycosylase 2 family protein [Planctomycetales bacterium]